MKGHILSDPEAHLYRREGPGEAVKESECFQKGIQLLIWNNALFHTSWTI